jgi:predicted  nucleic acid-binding Zn-ribbon protein
MDQELIAYLDKRFGENAQQFQGLRGEFETFRETTTRNFERVEEGIRHNGVSIEGARGEIRAVAEGVVGQNEKLEAFKKEVEQEFNDTRQLIRPVYSELDQRVRNLEAYVDLKKNDPLKIIKEQILGRPPE